MNKQRAQIRFANESQYTTIMIDILQLQQITVFPDEIFGTIDDIRIAMKKSEYNRLIEQTTKQPPN